MKIRTRKSLRTILIFGAVLPAACCLLPAISFAAGANPDNPGLASKDYVDRITTAAAADVSSKYALKSDIPDVSGFVDKNTANTISDNFTLQNANGQGFGISSTGSFMPLTGKENFGTLTNPWTSIVLKSYLYKVNGSANYTITIPDKTGTMALLSDIPTVPDVSGFVDMTTDQTIGGVKTFTDTIFGNALYFHGTATGSAIYQSDNDLRIGTLNETNNTVTPRWRFLQTQMIPWSDNTNTIGTSENAIKTIYTGSIGTRSSSSLQILNAGGQNMFAFAPSGFWTTTDNARDLGASAARWKTLYVMGLSDGENNIAMPDKSGTMALVSDIPAAYKLPAATTSALGGIRVGAGLNVTTDGILSAVVPTITATTTGTGNIITGISASGGTITATKANVQIPVGSATATTYATIWVE